MAGGGSQKVGNQKDQRRDRRRAPRAAKRILETTTVKDTVEEALREVARVEARRREVETLTKMEDLDLADPDVMAGSWRS
jgi:hypothetical protein